VKSSLFPGIFSAKGLGVLQRPAAADQSEPGIVLDPPDLLWRRWPDHLSRSPICAERTGIHQGSGFHDGQKGGEESHTLVTGEMAQHNHGLLASGPRRAM
jgi:hypothetical protein